VIRQAVLQVFDASKGKKLGFLSTEMVGIVSFYLSLPTSLIFYVTQSITKLPIFYQLAAITGRSRWDIERSMRHNLC
jgi:hypothetical protein